YGGDICLDVVRCGKVAMEKTGDEIFFQISDIVWMARFPGHGYLKPDPAPPVKLTFRIALDGDEICFTTSVPEGLDDETIEIRFPKTPIRFDSEQEGHLAGAWDSLGACLFYPSTERYFSDYCGILPVAGYFHCNGGVGIRTAQVCDHRLLIDIQTRAAGGNCAIVHEFDKGKSEYARTVHLKLFPAGSNYVSLAKWHRESVQKEGRFKTLREKITASPEVEKLAGSVIWKHNTYAVDVPPEVQRDYSLYVRTPEAAEAEGRPGNWSAREVFDTACDAGFDRVCIFNTGWNYRGFDSGYPTRFPPNPDRGSEADFRAAAEYGRSRSCGYIFCVHDNYRDVYPNSDEFSFDEIIVTQDGGKTKGGIWRGGRCYLMCGSQTIKYARRDLPRIAAMCGRGAIYLDVQGCTALRACYHPGHPCSRRDDARWRVETFREAKKHIGAVATEGAPHEFAVQDIDLGAYPHIRNGNYSNMKPIPFFQLVYHDSVYTFCGQGVSGVHGVEYSNRVALYAMLPWDFSPVSLRISQELRDTCTAEMVRHEFLSSTVERTLFSDGTTVCANFGDQEEWGIPAGDFKIYREK
ncbi:MAG: hypothetical protein IJV89_00385, partial [Lentisphaeria bacterium]|nr:hypothetical protein [Lentisphaeria bacterium]